MPKFTIEYAFDCACYGEVEIEAETADDAADKAKQMHAEDRLMNGWSPMPELSDNHRVVAIRTATGEYVDDGFSLAEPGEE